MIGHGQRRFRAVGILAEHRNMFTLLNHFKPQGTQRGQYLGLGSVHREFHTLNRRFGDVGIQRRTFAFQGLAPERLDVKTNGALDIVQGFVKRVPLADDDAVDADGIGNVSIGMFFNDDFHCGKLPLLNDRFKWMRSFLVKNPAPAMPGRGW